MKAGGFLLLALAALLVAMLVPAFALAADNGVTAPIFGTKINAQEEVAGIRAGENMTALAVPPWQTLASIINLIALAAVTPAVYFMRKRANQYSYKSTHSAGGDGFARFS